MTEDIHQEKLPRRVFVAMRLAELKLYLDALHAEQTEAKAAIETNDGTDRDAYRRLRHRRAYLNERVKAARTEQTSLFEERNALREASTAAA